MFLRFEYEFAKAVRMSEVDHRLKTFKYLLRFQMNHFNMPPDAHIMGEDLCKSPELMHFDKLCQTYYSLPLPFPNSIRLTSVSLK